MAKDSARFLAEVALRYGASAERALAAAEWAFAHEDTPRWHG